MINLYSEAVVAGRVLYTYTGLSTDTKPTQNITGGSMFIEIDTSTLFIFDESGQTWVAWGASDE